MSDLLHDIGKMHVMFNALDRLDERDLDEFEMLMKSVEARVGQVYAREPLAACSSAVTFRPRGFRNC